METVSIQSKNPFSLKIIQDKLAQHWTVEPSPGETLVVHGPKSRSYIYPEKGAHESTPYRLMIDYSEVELAKRVLEVIADAPDVVVDNDFGNVPSCRHAGLMCADSNLRRMV